MTNNIVLSGGTTMIPGFSQRIKSALPFHLKNEMMVVTHSPFQVVAEGNRDISTWIGASMIASMSSFDKIFLRREDYHESGEDRVSLFSKNF